MKKLLLASVMVFGFAAAFSFGTSTAEAADYGVHFESSHVHFGHGKIHYGHTHLYRPLPVYRYRYPSVIRYPVVRPCVPRYGYYGLPY
jgi:hypothetical protein